MSQIEINKDILIQFLEVAFNTILYFRKLYPDEIFARKKIYGTAVHITIHPELNEYIKNVLVAVKELVNEDKSCIKAVHLTILNSKSAPLEKYVFDFISLQDNILEKDPYLLKTEEALRTICLKLSMCQSYLKPLPDDTTFSIEIVTHEAGHISLNENSKCERFPWIVSENDNEMKNKSLLPLKTVHTENLILQMYAIEDTVAKESNQ